MASSPPEANGFNVQLYFDGAPLGSPMVVGQPGVVTVRRIQQQLDRCTQSTATCDPTAITPIVLVSATCDDGVCTVTPHTTAEQGVVALETTGVQPGVATLRVRVRSTVDGSEWDDGYPLSFRAPRPSFANVPAAHRMPLSPHAD